MTYGFNLEWNELAEDLRFEKVYYYYHSFLEEGEYSDVIEGKREAGMTEEEAVEELFEEEYHNLEKTIANHFPIYF